MDEDWGSAWEVWSPREFYPPAGGLSAISSPQQPYVEATPQPQSYNGGFTNNMYQPPAYTDLGSLNIPGFNSPGGPGDYTPPNGAYPPFNSSDGGYYPAWLQPGSASVALAPPNSGFYNTSPAAYTPVGGGVDQKDASGIYAEATPQPVAYTDSGSLNIPGFNSTGDPGAYSPFNSSDGGYYPTNAIGAYPSSSGFYNTSPYTDSGSLNIPGFNSTGDPGDYIPPNRAGFNSTGDPGAYSPFNSTAMGALVPPSSGFYNTPVGGGVNQKDAAGTAARLIASDPPRIEDGKGEGGSYPRRGGNNRSSDNGTTWLSTANLTGVNPTGGWNANGTPQNAPNGPTWLSMANLTGTNPTGWTPNVTPQNAPSNNKNSDDKKAGGFNMADTLGKLATSGISSALSAYGPAAQSQSALLEQQRQMLADASVADNARRAEQTKLFNSASNDYQNIMSPEDRYKRAYGDVIASSNAGNMARAREMTRSGRTYGANEQRRGNVMQYAAADTAGNAASDNAAATRMRAAGALSGMYPAAFNPQIASGYNSLANSYGARAAATSRGIGEMAGLATTGLFNSQFMKNRLNAPTSTTDETP